jgi:hypothetical protein
LFHVIAEIESVDVSIILGLYSMEHIKVVFRDPTSNLIFVCSIV